MSSADLAFPIGVGAPAPRRRPVAAQARRAARPPAGEPHRWWLLPLTALAHLAAIAWLADASRTSAGPAMPDEVIDIVFVAPPAPAPASPPRTAETPPATAEPEPPREIPPPPIEAPAPMAKARPRPKPRTQTVPREPAAPEPSLQIPQLDLPPPSPSAFAPAAPAVAPAAPAPAPSTVARRTEARFDADYLSNPRPAYPALARRLGEQGTVLLRVRVTPGGEAAEVKLLRGSGSPRLDRAALLAVEQWRFVPAREGDETVASWVQVPIAFTLE